MATEGGPPPALDSSLGALTIGSMISLTLYGAMCVQAYCYYQHNFKNDPLHIKILVPWCFIVETTHTFFMAISIYTMTITHFGDYAYLPVAHWPLSYSVLLAAFVNGPVQIFFAFRVYTLSKNKIIPFISVLGSLTRAAMAMADSIVADKVKLLSIFSTKYTNIIVGALVVGMAVDILNTVSLCWILMKSKTKIASSRKMVDTLVIWTVETGLLTSVANTAALILVLVMPDEPAWLCPVFFTAKLYSNSLLASLNGRVSLRAMTGGTSHLSLTLTTFSGTYGPTTDNNPNQAAGSGIVLRPFGPHGASVSNRSTTRRASEEYVTSVNSTKKDPEAI